MPVTRYPNADHATGIHSTAAQKVTAALEAFELDNLEELDPNAREVFVRKIAMLDDESLTHLILAVEQAKTRYAAAQP